MIAWPHDVVRAAERSADRAMSLMRQVRDGAVLSPSELAGVRRDACGLAQGTPACVREAHRELARAYETL